MQYAEISISFGLRIWPSLPRSSPLGTWKRKTKDPAGALMQSNPMSHGISLRKQTFLLAHRRWENVCFLRLPWNGVWFEVSSCIGSRIWSTAVKTFDRAAFLFYSKGFYSHVIGKSGNPLIRSPYISRTLFDSDSTRIIKKSRKENAKDQQSWGVAILAPAVVTFRETRSLSGYQVICFRSLFLAGSIDARSLQIIWFSGHNNLLWGFIWT